MRYNKTLEAAGAKVFAYEEFGSYQGDWAALVEYRGEIGIAFGSYGSCSGCDSYLAMFDDYYEPQMHDGKYYKSCFWDEDDEISKEEYDRFLSERQKKMADFGADYLHNLADRNIIETRIANLKADDWFDGEQKEMLEWCIKQFDSLNGN